MARGEYLREKQVDVGGGAGVFEVEGFDDGFEFGLGLLVGVVGEQGFEFDEATEVVDFVDVDAGGVIDVEMAGLGELARFAQGVGEGGEEGLGVDDGCDDEIGGGGGFIVGAAVGDEFGGLVAVDEAELEASVRGGEEEVLLVDDAAIGGAEFFGGFLGGGEVFTVKFLFEIFHGGSPFFRSCLYKYDSRERVAEREKCAEMRIRGERGGTDAPRYGGGGIGVAFLPEGGMGLFVGGRRGWDGELGAW